MLVTALHNRKIAVNNNIFWHHEVYANIKRTVKCLIPLIILHRAHRACQLKCFCLCKYRQIYLLFIRINKTSQLLKSQWHYHHVHQKTWHCLTEYFMSFQVVLVLYRLSRKENKWEYNYFIYFKSKMKKWLSAVGIWVVISTFLCNLKWMTFS